MCFIWKESGNRKKAVNSYYKAIKIPEPYTVNINTASAARLQQVAKANDVSGMTGFFKNLVKERENNGNFRDINEVERRMNSIAKEDHIDKLETLEKNNKLIY
ncbi:hypothetical protein [Flavobacterium suncheonense]|uniref:hypothetical protein n=1 Tax=Flavobacterium suncheonense TaxID=350894 RepID=UPI003FA38A75